MSLKDTFIVLRTNQYRDADLIVSLLGKEKGKINAYARGARNSKKRFPGGIEVFDLATITLEASRRNKENVSIKEYKRIGNWNKIRQSISSFSHACLCTEAINNITRENDLDSKILFKMLYSSLKALEKAENKKEKVAVTSFLLISALSASGFFSVDELGVSNDSTKEWANAMLIEKAPIIPFDENLAPKGLESIVQLYIKTTERNLNSWEFLKKDL